MRSTIRDALRQQGLDNIDMSDNAASLESFIDRTRPDLIIADADLPEVPDIVRRTRMREIGGNPYVVIALTVTQPGDKQLRDLFATGADTVIAKPVSTASLLNQIHKLRHQRQPFVVTSQYVGPDRFGDPKPANSPDRFEVPNSFAAKMSGERVLDEELEQLIADSDRRVVVEKLRRYAFQLVFLVEISRGEQSVRFGAETRDPLSAIEDVVDAMIEDGEDHFTQPTVELLKSLQSVVRRGAGKKGLSVSHDHLSEVAQGIWASVKNDLPSDPDRQRKPLEEELQDALQHYLRKAPTTA